MSNLNTVVLEGRLTRSAELSHFQDGTAYCNFSIGNNETYKDGNGEYQSIGSFFDCAMKGSYAEAMAKHLIKGRGVTVVGRLKQQRWEKDGQKFSRVIIKVEELHLAHNSDANNVQQAANNGYNNAQQSQSFTQNEAMQPDQQYIPFGATGSDSFPEDIPF